MGRTVTTTATSTSSATSTETDTSMGSPSSAAGTEEVDQVPQQHVGSGPAWWWFVVGAAAAGGAVAACALVVQKRQKSVEVAGSQVLVGRGTHRCVGMHGRSSGARLLTDSSGVLVPCLRSALCTMQHKQPKQLLEGT